MNAEVTFPLPWEQVLWSSAPSFPVSLSRVGTRYAFTDFRLVVNRRNRTIDELALHDIENVCLTQAWWQRLAGTSTVRVFSRRRRSPLELANIRHGPQLALVLQLRATEPFGDDARALDRDFFRSALGPGALSILRPRGRIVLAVAAVFALILGIFGLTGNAPLPPVIYATDDPVAPHGSRRSTEAITAFMEREVMPFARHALGPLVGGADKVTCETCHGSDAKQRAVAHAGCPRAARARAAARGTRARKIVARSPDDETPSTATSQKRTNSRSAAYMRQVVMPGMAKLMHRPAYDFAKSYGYNRSRAAVGCYHCHLVE